MKAAWLRVWAKEDLRALGLYSADMGGVGSTRWASNEESRPVWGWRLGAFPAVRLCFERGDHLDVARLLGERQDITSILAAGIP